MLATLAVLLGMGACGGPGGPHVEHHPRLLDKICQGDQCTITGAVRRTTGLTSDSVGYQLGPGAGSIVIPSPGNNASVLVRGHGALYDNCTGSRSGCVASNVPANYTWIDVLSTIESDGGPGAAADGGLGEAGDAGPADAGGGRRVLVLSVEDNGSVVHLGDVRTSETLLCSVAPAGPR